MKNLSIQKVENRFGYVVSAIVDDAGTVMVPYTVQQGCNGEVKYLGLYPVGKGCDGVDPNAVTESTYICSVFDFCNSQEDLESLDGWEEEDPEIQKLIIELLKLL